MKNSKAENGWPLPLREFFHRHLPNAQRYGDGGNKILRIELKSWVYRRGVRLRSACSGAL